MGLWDVVTGKVYRWNRAKENAAHSLCCRLAQQFPREQYRLPRRLLWCHLMCAQGVLSRFFFEGEGKEYGAALADIDGVKLNRLMSSLAYHFFASMFFECGGSQDALNSACCYYAVTTAAYARPPEDTKSWAELTALGERFAVDGEMILEVSGIIPFDTKNQRQLASWLSVSLATKQRTCHLGVTPDIDNIVDAELAAQLKRAR
jgi:hypothetical protein